MTNAELNAIADAVAERLRQSAALEPISVDERAAARLTSLSVRTLYALRKAGEIPHTTVGGRVLYSPNELRQWLAEKRQNREVAGAAS